jgi:putative methyltransferase (TIGR04325 family)
MFNTWDEAANAAALESKETLQAFDTSRWIKRQESMLSSARSGVSPRFTNLPLLVGATGARSVVDLGGGSGWTFELVSHSNSAALDRYTVIEQKTSVDAFSLSFITDDRVEFVASEKNSDGQLDSVDILYSNSALQYFPDNKSLTQLVTTCTPDWILLDDIQAALDGDFFSMQHYYGAEIPCRFFDVNSMVEEIRNLGYALKGNWEYPASIGGVLEPTLGGRVDTKHDIGTPRSLLFEAL